MTALAHSRRVIEARRSGAAASQFQASQQVATIASWSGQTRWPSLFCRRYSHTFSTGFRRYGAAGAGERPSAPGTADGVPHAAVQRPEPVPRRLPAGQHARRRGRAEPVELARRRAGARDRAQPAQEARPERGSAARPAPALAGRGGQGRAHDHPPRGRLRGRPRRVLARPLAAGARRRGPRHPPDERRGLTGAPARQDGPPGHRAAQARLPRLAARRAGPLQHGRDPDAGAGGRQTPEPRAGGPGRRAHPNREPDEGRPGPPRRPQLQAGPARRAGAPGGAAHGGGRAAAAEHARRAAPRHGPAAARAGADRGGRGGAPATAGGGARVAPARDGAPAGPGGRGRARDRRHAGARGALARAAGPYALARYAGLTGSPDESGARRREKGLARVGNARVRRGMLQLAWRFLRFQGDSHLARWYRARIADARGGTRKTMIVALARKLLIALWRLVTTGEAPEGVVLRPAG